VRAWRIKVNSGFLSDEDYNVIRGDESPNKKSTKPKEITCAQCRQSRICTNSKLSVWGQGKKKIMFVLDNPSEKEDQARMPFRGEYGKILREELEHDTGLNFEKDVWTVYAVRCRGKVDALSVGACRNRLHDDIRELDPAVIVPFGYWAMMAVSGDILNNSTSGKNSGDWAGEVIPDQRWLKYIVPTWEPFWLNLLDRIPDPVYRKQMVLHIKKAIELAKENKPIKKCNDEKRINIIYEVNKAIELIEKFIESPPEYMAFDYETTGRKPYREGHRIYSAAISNGIQSWAFPFFKDESFQSTWKKLLRHRKIKWIAHNAKFEWIWTKVIEGYWPRNIEADTMLGAKVFNNNRRVGLKPLVYCRYGITYNDEVDDYLTTPTKEESMYGANGFNLIDQADPEKVLKYNAFDPLYTFWLYRDFQTDIMKRLQKGYNFFTKSSIQLARAEVNGMLIDVEGVEREKQKINKLQDKLLKEMIQEADENGWDKSKPFRPSASADISHLLYDLMGHKPDKFTKTGASTDKNTLEKIDEPIVKKILEWKKFDKLGGTYLDGTAREAVNGKINPFFNLHTVTTYRSSSDSPNFQNFPKRDKLVSTIIRSLLMPHPGQRLVEYDYKGIEVCVSACYNKDPNLIKYIKDPTTDMHRDTGEELFLYKRGELPKELRQVAKNAFVFPEFYGSYFEQCAKNLWNDISKDEQRRLGEVGGIRNLFDFTEHVQQIEKDFWDRRFPVYKQWKKDIYNFYLKNGYVDSYTGFRYFGPMKKNEACNYAIQGSAFHCLLRTFSILSEKIEKEKLRSKMVGQIHDSAIPSVHPDEEQYLDSIMWYEGTQTIREEWDWIIVPLNIEKSFGEIDGNWASMKEAGLLNEKVPIIEYWK